MRPGQNIFLFFRDIQANVCYCVPSEGNL
jgi:hypothetical protein